MNRRALLLGASAAAACASTANAFNGFSISNQGSHLLPYRYPNFPQWVIWKLRSTSDLYNVPSGASNITNTPTGGGVRLVLSTTTQVIATKIFSTPIDLRNGNIKFWLRFPDGANTNLNTYRIVLGSTGTPTTGSTIPTNGGSIKNMLAPSYSMVFRANAAAWQPISYSTGNLNTLGTGVDLQNVTWIQLQASTTSGTRTIDVTDMVFQPNPRTKPAVIFRSDDAQPLGYTWLYNALKTAGYPGPMINGGAAASSAGYDQYLRITTDQQNEMRRNGGQFMSQSWMTENIPGSGLASDYDAQYAGMKAWTRGKGWMDGYADGSWYTNVSQLNETARTSMVKSGVRTIQNFTNGSPTNPPTGPMNTFPFGDPTNLLAISAGGDGGTTTTIPTYMQYMVDAVTPINGVLIVAGHTDWSDSNVQTAVNNIIANANSGILEIHTMNSLLNPWLAKYGPMPDSEFRKLIVQ